MCNRTRQSRRLKDALEKLQVADVRALLAQWRRNMIRSRHISLFPAAGELRGTFMKQRNLGHIAGTRLAIA